MKSFQNYLIIVCFSFPGMLLAQLCTIPTSLSESRYEVWDIPVLALEQMAGLSLVEIPDSLKQPYRHALSAMFHSTETIPEADSIINIYCIQHFSDVPLFMYVYVDTSVAWVRGWVDADTITTHPILDSMINRYDLEADYDPFTSIQGGHLLTTRLVNIQPIIDTLFSIEGVLDVSAEGYIGDGSLIQLAGSNLTFITKWESCPVSCAGERVYEFEIMDSCSAEFLGAYTTHPIPPGHAMIFNCQLTTHTIDISREPGLKVFPNPATNKLTVDLDDPQGRVRNYRITDLLGRNWRSGLLDPAGTIDIEVLPSGWYVVSIQMDDTVWQARWMKF